MTLLERVEDLINSTPVLPAGFGDDLKRLLIQELAPLNRKLSSLEEQVAQLEGGVDAVETPTALAEQVAEELIGEDLDSEGDSINNYADQAAAESREPVFDEEDFEYVNDLDGLGA